MTVGEAVIDHTSAVRHRVQVHHNAVALKVAAAAAIVVVVVRTTRVSLVVTLRSHTASAGIFKGRQVVRCAVGYAWELIDEAWF